jgi:drug/metabolite transporter (DMT)-like permease
MNSKKMTYIALVCTVLFWGLSFVGTKVALISFTPFVYIFLRFSLASVLFLILLIRKGLPKLSASDHKKLFLTAFFEPGLYFTFETIGLTYTTASKASIIISIVPIAVVLLARVVLKEKINGRSLSGILLSIVGILVLVLGDPTFSLSFEGSTIGDILILCAVISSALYITFARDLGQKLSSLVITSFQMFYGTIFFAPMFILNVGSVNWSQVSAKALGAIIFLTIFATILSFLFYNYALTQIPASRAAIFINGIPVVTAIGAWVILGERLTLLQVTGGFLVLVAVIIANMSSKENISAPVTPSDNIEMLE